MKLNKLRKWLIEKVLKVKATEVKGGVITKIIRSPRTAVLTDEYKVCHTELEYLEREQKEEVLRKLKKESVMRLCQEILDKMLFKYEKIDYPDPYLRETEINKITLKVIKPLSNE